MKRLLPIVLLIVAACELRAAPLPRTILVFPFENRSNRPNLNWISESFSETLSRRLAGPDRFVLSRRERDTAFEQLGIPAGTPVTLASVYKVAETLGVDWAVTGNFAVEGNRLTAQAQLLDVRRLKLANPLETTGELADLAELQTRLAWRLLATQDPSFTVGKEEDFARLLPPIRLDAYENFIRGVLATDKESRIRFLAEADRLDPADHRAAFELGRFYYGEKDYENSARWLRKIEEKDASSLEAQFMLGVDEFFLGHDAAAERAFEALSRQMPLNEVWNNLGLMQARRGRFEAATASFERACQGDPTDPIFCFNLGLCLLYRKKYPEAIRHLREALRLSADDPEVHALLAAALGAVDGTKGKETESNRLSPREGSELQESGKDLVTHLRLKKNYNGRAYRLLALAVGNAPEDKLRGESTPRHAEVHLARGKEFLDAGRPREAAIELETALKLNNTVAAHLMLARVYLSLDQLQAARDHSQAALSMDPNNREAQALMNAISLMTPGERKTP
jgi:tetratricopeptide (TPR) repeat protein